MGARTTTKADRFAQTGRLSLFLAPEDVMALLVLSQRMTRSKLLEARLGTPQEVQQMGIALHMLKVKALASLRQGGAHV